MLEFLNKLKEIQEERPVRIVFVCTANCCRSPIAEILFEKMLIRELGSLEKIAEKNLIVESAATSYSGCAIAEKSAQVLIQEEGIKAFRCRTHRGRLLSEIDPPDLILTMSQRHQKDIEMEYPDWYNIVFPLDHFVKYDKRLTASDITDPIGGSDEDFIRIKEQIKTDLVLLINEFKKAGLI